MNARKAFPLLSLFLILSFLFAIASPAGAARVDAGAPAQGGSLYWNTFLGGSGWDHGEAIAVDGGGNTYLSGWSEEGWGHPIRAYEGLGDVYVVKLGSSGNLDWHTFLGSDDEDFARGMVIDSSGNIYVVGTSNQTWGDPMNPFVGGPAYDDVFVAKLDNTGALVWNTFLGGSTEEHGYGIAVDGSGNVYVTGRAWASWGDPVSPFTGTASNAFAAMLDTDGMLVWNTFLGGEGDDLGIGIAVEGSQNLYIAGGSGSTWGKPVRSFTGISPFGDAFVAKLQSSDGVLTWNTFLGGESDDTGIALALDGSGNIYIAGWSVSAWGSPVTAYAKYEDAFAARLDNNGVLVWNTFLGGDGFDYGTGLAIDAGGNILISGQCTGTWGTPLRPFAAETDAFAARLDANGARSWNTFLGGSGFDQAFAIAVDGKRNAYLTGGSDGGWGSPIDPYAGSRDTFVAKLGIAGSFRSVGSQDGWVLESAETSNKGGTMNSAGTTFNLGDDAADRQYRAVLSFNTSALPEGAVITKAVLKIKRQGLSGINPFDTHMGLKADIRKTYFGTSAALAVNDFQAGANMAAAATFNKTTAAGWWYSANLSEAAYPYINRSGLTQFRLRFAKDDNDDLGADYLKFYSGGAGTASYRPVLVVEYYVP